MHDCPECGMACYCSGDIEDHDTGNEFVTDCACCLDRDERHALDDQDWQAGDRDEPESLVMYCGWFAAHEKEKPTCQRIR